MQTPCRGVNFFLLSAAKYAAPYWLTLRQANGLGRAVSKEGHGEALAPRSTFDGFINCCRN
jgi:antirestriction protein ArdC